VDEKFQPEDFTIVTIHKRVKGEGDLWAGHGINNGVNLHAPIPKKG
jgi:hypothetical protein